MESGFEMTLGCLCSCPKPIWRWLLV